MIRKYRESGYNESSTTNQRILERLVNKEVIYNVSRLINYFASRPESLDGSGYDWDEVLDICRKDDWQEAAEEEGFYKSDGIIWDQDNKEINAQDWQDVCEEEGIEPLVREALEHWIISPFLANKLKEKGEMVGEILGMTIWGRETSGQAILLDGIIAKIALDMEILEGQKYEW